MLLNKKLLITAALLLSATANHASTTYDFTNPGTSSTEIGSGFGNALDFGNMVATSWATTGDPDGANSLINSAQILRFNTGLGSCNREEGAGCSNPQHQFDNYGDDDYVLFVFDQQVQFDNIVIDPFGKFDRDVSFWITDLTSLQTDLTGLDPASLDITSALFGINTLDKNKKGSGAITIDLNNRIGNALLFAPRADAGNKKDNDAFKISSLEVTAVVPVPAAVWLFGSGLIGLVGLARRKS
jgi:hypothetical protein